MCCVMWGTVFRCALFRGVVFFVGIIKLCYVVGVRCVIVKGCVMLCGLGCGYVEMCYVKLCWAVVRYDISCFVGLC